MSEYSQYIQSIPWQIVRLRFEFEALTSIRFPPFAGSMLRGVFGRALRSVSCMTKLKSCEGCPLRTNCPYSRIFEPKLPDGVDAAKFSSVPAGYVFEPMLWGAVSFQPKESILFDLVLFGDEVNLVPLVIFALQKGFLRGIGHGEAALKSVYQVSDHDLVKIYEREDEEVKDFNRFVYLKKSSCPSCEIQVETPLRIQREGKILNSDELSPKIFFTALIRRVDLMCKTHMRQIEIPFSQLLEEAENVEISKTLSIRQWTRFFKSSEKPHAAAGSSGKYPFHKFI